MISLTLSSAVALQRDENLASASGGFLGCVVVFQISMQPHMSNVISNP